MAAVSPVPAGLRPLWYRSFYWRIAASFIALVVIVLVGQSLMFSYLLTRPQGAFTPGDPNASATAVAAHVSDDGTVIDVCTGTGVGPTKR